VIAWIAASFRWLIGSLLGCLVVLVAIYTYLRVRGPVTPFDMDGLLSWFTDQSSSTKLGVGALMMTMIGFMFAFWTTSATWRRHKEFELRIEAAKEVHARFQRALGRLLSINAYFHLLLLATENARKLNSNDPAAAWHLTFPNSGADQFQRDRAELDSAIMEVRDLRAAFATVVANVPGATSAIERAERTLAEAQQLLWPISPPRSDPSSADFVHHFLSQCVDPQLLSAKLKGEKAYAAASTLSGFAQGRLLRGVVPPNLTALLHLSKNWKSLAQAISHIASR
jgi:hypothetical protein